MDADWCALVSVNTLRKHQFRRVRPLSPKPVLKAVDKLRDKPATPLRCWPSGLCSKIKHLSVILVLLTLKLRTMHGLTGLGRCRRFRVSKGGLQGWCWWGGDLGRPGVSCPWTGRGTPDHAADDERAELMAGNYPQHLKSALALNRQEPYIP